MKLDIMTMTVNIKMYKVKDCFSEFKNRCLSQFPKLNPSLPHPCLDFHKLEEKGEEDFPCGLLLTFVKPNLIIKKHHAYFLGLLTIKEVPPKELIRC